MSIQVKASVPKDYFGAQSYNSIANCKTYPKKNCTSEHVYYVQKALSRKKSTALCTSGQHFYCGHGKSEVSWSTKCLLLVIILIKDNIIQSESFCDFSYFSHFQIKENFGPHGKLRNIFLALGMWLSKRKMTKKHLEQAKMHAQRRLLSSSFCWWLKVTQATIKTKQNFEKCVYNES